MNLEQFIAQQLAEFDKLFPAQSSKTGNGLRHYFSTPKKNVTWDIATTIKIEEHVISFIADSIKLAAENAVAEERERLRK